MISQEQEKNARLHAFVEGRVQGVNFRYNTTRTAEKLGLTGWVANRRDGRVEAVAEGPKDALEKLLAFLHEGRMLALDAPAALQASLPGRVPGAVPRRPPDAPRCRDDRRRRGFRTRRRPGRSDG